MKVLFCPAIAEVWLLGVEDDEMKPLLLLGPTPYCQWLATVLADP